MSSSAVDILKRMLKNYRVCKGGGVTNIAQGMERNIYGK